MLELSAVYTDMDRPDDARPLIEEVIDYRRPSSSTTTALELLPPDAQSRSDYESRLTDWER